MTNEDVIKVLMSLGSAAPNRTNEALIFQTVCHNHSSDDMKFKLYYYFNSKSFRCYTECNDSFDIYTLVTRAKAIHGINLDFYEALDYVNSILDNKFAAIPKAISNTSSNISDDWDIFNEQLKLIAFEENIKSADSDIAASHLTIYNANVIDLFTERYYEGWLREGISVEAMRKYGIKYYTPLNKIIIPYYHHLTGQLIGLRGRALNESEIKAGFKYMPLNVGGTSYSHKTSLTMYGYYQNKYTIQKYDTLVLFEGEKSVLKMETLYPENISVAISGSTVSATHISLIENLKVKKIIIAMDKEYTSVTDPAFVVFMQKVKKIADRLRHYSDVYAVVDRDNLIDFKSSPIDHGIDTFRKLIQSVEKL